LQWGREPLTFATVVCNVLLKKGSVGSQPERRLDAMRPVIRNGILREGTRKMHMPSDTTKRQIETAAHEIRNGATAHVIDVSLELRRDWSGDWAVFFRILLRNQSSKGIMLGRVTTEIRKRLSDKLRALNIRLVGYFEFHSESEMAEMQLG